MKKIKKLNNQKINNWKKYGKYNRIWKIQEWKS